MPKAPDDIVVIAGASGLIGRALVASYEADGIRVIRLVRRPAHSANEHQWRDGTNLNPEVLRGARAVVCLNGASIGSFPWTAKKRIELRQSRVLPRQDLARALHTLGSDAPLLVHASAVGYYGSSPNGIVSEDAPRGEGFVADLAAATEEATTLTDTPVTHARLGIVLDPDGVLAPLIPLTLLNLAGRIGSGTQSWPWESLPDAVGAIKHIVDHQLTGAVNVVGPSRATANDIGFAVARELNKPFLVPAPAFAMRAVLGAEAADNLLLVDEHVEPARLQQAGYAFVHENAEDAIHDALSPLRLD